MQQLPCDQACVWPDEALPGAVGWGLGAEYCSWYGSYPYTPPTIYEPGPDQVPFVFCESLEVPDGFHTYAPHVTYGLGPGQVPFVFGNGLKLSPPPVQGFDASGASDPMQVVRAHDGADGGQAGAQEEVVDLSGEAAPERPSRSPEHVQELARQFGRPSEVGDMQARCTKYIANLDGMSSPDKARKAVALRVMDWVTCCPQHLEDLSFARQGCRVLQKAMDVGSSEDREAMAETLIPMTARLLECKHGNHVLAKLIEVLPPAKLGGVVAALRGQTGAVARKRFGCRILERLIEHCNGTQVGALLDEVLADIEALARHQYGNFVVQHLFEHGDPERKARACAILLDRVTEHAKHRTASHVVQRLLDHADVEHQRRFVARLLERPAFDPDHSLEAVMSARYGSFVVQQLLDKEHPLRKEVEERVRAALGHLQESPSACRNILEHLCQSRPDFFDGVAVSDPCNCDICERLRETKRAGLPAEE